MIEKPRGTGCMYCNNKGRIDVLDIWGTQRRVRGGDTLDNALGPTANDLPMLREVVICPHCGDEETHLREWAEMLRENGGDPWDDKTYKGH